MLNVELSTTTSTPDQNPIITWPKSPKISAWQVPEVDPLVRVLGTLVETVTLCPKIELLSFRMKLPSTPEPCLGICLIAPCTPGVVAKFKVPVKALSAAIAASMSTTLAYVTAPPLVPMATTLVSDSCKIPEGSLEPPPFIATWSILAAIVCTMSFLSICSTEGSDCNASFLV